MAKTDIRQWWCRERDSIVDKAVKSKSAQSAWFELSQLYSSLSPKEKASILPVLTDWIESNDASKRSDAIWLVREHKILEAKPALEQLRMRLKDCKIPGDPQGYHECQKIIKVLKALDSNTQVSR